MGTRGRRGGEGHYGFVSEQCTSVLFLSGWKLQQGAVHGAQPGSAKLERRISAQTGKILLICSLTFPGVLNRCFFKPGNLAEEPSPITNFEENGSDSFVCLMESHHSA